MKGPLAQMQKLLRLAQLRETLAQRDVALARRAVHDRQAEVEAFITDAQTLAAEQEARRSALRNPLLGSPQLRGALASVLTTFEADRDREAKAERRIADAHDAVLAAQKQLEARRAIAVQANRLRQKRDLLCTNLAERRDRELELRAERESEDFQARPPFAEDAA